MINNNNDLTQILSNILPEDKIAKLSIFIGLCLSIGVIVLTGVKFRFDSLLSIGTDTYEYTLEVINNLFLPSNIKYYLYFAIFILIILLLVHLPYFIRSLQIYFHIQKLDNNFNLIKLTKKKHSLPEPPKIQGTLKKGKVYNDSFLDYSEEYNDSILFSTSGYSNLISLLKNKKLELEEQILSLQVTILDYIKSMTIGSLKEEEEILQTVKHDVKRLQTHRRNLALVHKSLYKKSMEDPKYNINHLNNKIKNAFDDMREIQENIKRIKSLEIDTIWAFSKLEEYLVLERNDFYKTLQHLENSEISQFIDTENRVLKIQYDLKIPGVGKVKPCCYDTAKSGSKFCHCGGLISDELIEYTKKK